MKKLMMMTCALVMMGPAAFADDAAQPVPAPNPPAAAAPPPSTDSATMLIQGNPNTINAPYSKMEYCLADLPGVLKAFKAACVHPH